MLPAKSLWLPMEGFSGRQRQAHKSAGRNAHCTTVGMPSAPVQLFWEESNSTRADMFAQLRGSLPAFGTHQGYIGQFFKQQTQGQH